MSRLAPNLPSLAPLAPLGWLGRRVLPFLGLAGLWWFSVALFAASRSGWVERVGRAAAESLAWLIPARPPLEPSAACVFWPPSEPREVWCTFAAVPHSPGLPGLLARGLPDVRFLDVALVQSMLLPAHFLACTAALWAVSRLGYPARDLPLRDGSAWTAFKRSIPMAALWLALPPFLAVLWFQLSDPSLSSAHRHNANALPLIDASEATLRLLAWGALIGYAGSVLAAARSTLGLAGRGRSADAMPSCHACGYTADQARPCPECGAADPSAVAGVYLARWHARLARGRRIDVVALVPAVIAGVLMLWPLLSGMLFGRRL